MTEQEATPNTANDTTPSKEEEIDLAQLTNSHRKWLKTMLGLSAIEAKIWMASGAQLVAFVTGVVFLLVTSWLLLIAVAATAAYAAGFPLLGILIVALLLTLLSSLGLVYLIKRTLKRMDITRTLDAIIPTDEED
ncbi:hypothetical protein [Marinomonas ostreistagni]|uniref:hypothetical protein n=1 Tax=Marinomonas ostreistagni TaxID=359209 RepID=UPI0019527613|nr:hypothetical protein [Marinomonas ostreistagni]MBM6552086.1 hypothetical protein [Marinomonas ostreistagni]